MTRPEDYSVIQDVVKLLANDGFDGLGEAIRRIINEAMRLERQNHLGVGPYERSDERRGYANGYKPKTVQTRVGALDFDVPQVRDSSFYPSSLEKGLRSERALKVALAEMYVPRRLDPQGGQDHRAALRLRGHVHPGESCRKGTRRSPRKMA